MNSSWFLVGGQKNLPPPPRINFAFASKRENKLLPWCIDENYLSFQFVFLGIILCLPVGKKHEQEELAQDTLVESLPFTNQRIFTPILVFWPGFLYRLIFTKSLHFHFTKTKLGRDYFRWKYEGAGLWLWTFSFTHCPGICPKMTDKNETSQRRGLPWRGASKHFFHRWHRDYDQVEGLSRNMPNDMGWSEGNGICCWGSGKNLWFWLEITFS